ncbi:hypothetical protein [Kitasatospora sp. MAP5-34]|uniref:hypothetical protein n=1 Tax=Kitasatospora sp. MAP5-34 TaxID=3035102 RepID=UPI002474955B|nr:hypothetical protein [Kitasatospora sp. MAP5-34]MDH6575356.1 hypothetical protein [Kitasatospora sp. MAP5-34]
MAHASRHCPAPLRSLVVLALAGLTAAILPGPGAALADDSSCRTGGPRPRTSYGTAEPLGSGTVRTYAELDGKRPVAVGVVLTRSALDNLPTEMTDRKRCFDVNGDGVIEEATECAGGHEHILDLPPALLALPGMPLEWSLLNWQPMGHGPVGVYDKPHLDVHFYLQPKAERDAIRPGPCGIVINCEDFATATKPVPPEYLPADHGDKGLAEVGMGNHLPDLTAGEWHGVPFDRTFIYGAYDARITFLEPMITVADLQRTEAGTASGKCADIKQPQAWQQPGWYPRQYCVRYRGDRQQFTISLEDFSRR